MADFEKNLSELFNEIDDAISSLLLSRYFVREFERIIKSNARINHNNHFFIWIIENYLRNASIAVRRITDSDRRTGSLFNLLSVLKNNTARISRRVYIEEFVRDGGFNKKEANEFYDMLQGRGNEGPTPEDIRTDTKLLISRAKKVKVYVDKVVAHNEYRARETIESPGRLPTVGELDACIDLIEELFNKYYALTYQGAFGSLLPVIQYPWKQIFEIPWKSK